MTLGPLADVRTLIAKHLPEHFRDKQSWRHVAAELDKAAAGDDTTEASLALCMALSLEGVECRPKRRLFGGLGRRLSYKLEFESGPF
jgi:hypothetical protein